jgi:hypothetical protein
MALVLERVPGWETLSREVKSFISLVVAALLGVVSYALVRWVPAGVVAELEPYYQVILTAVTIWLGSQYAHWAVNQRKDRLTPPGTEG